MVLQWFIKRERYFKRYIKSILKDFIMYNCNFLKFLNLEEE